MATAMFTVFRAVLVERLPVFSPDRLVVLRSLNHGSTKVDPSGTVIAVNRSAVTANFFDVLGARPLLGRRLRPEDGAEGAPHVIVVTYGAWKRRFGGDPQIVGRTLVDPQTRWQFRIVGVAPPGLDYRLRDTARPSTASVSPEVSLIQPAMP